jgi:two-component system sensor histidine kinase RegB
MAVLLNELDKQVAEQLGQGDIKDDISLLRQQVTRCKHSLTQLIRYYNKDNPEEEDTIELKSFVGDIQDYIVNIHPAASVNFTIGDNVNPDIASNLSLKHAVINIIENGIKAAESVVTIAFKIVKTSPAHFEISINDAGPGIPARVLENLGEPFISTHKASMGLGIFLANASIQRLGGSIEMLNLKSGGALTLIKLPLPEYQQV